MRNELMQKRKTPSQVRNFERRKSLQIMFLLLIAIYLDVEQVLI
jgi:hypothetical protein